MAVKPNEPDTPRAPGASRPAAYSDGAVADPDVGSAPRMNTGIGPQRDAPAQGSPTRARHQQVRDLMTADVEVCDPHTGLDYIARMMAERDVGAIPVVESTDTMKPVGIITDRDIVVRIIAKGQAVDEVTAEDCMSTDLFTLSPETGVEQCIRQMEEHRVRRAPVVDPDGRCIGIITQADIAERARSEQTAELLQDLSHPPGHQGAYH